LGFVVIPAAGNLVTTKNGDPKPPHDRLMLERLGRFAPRLTRIRADNPQTQNSPHFFPMNRMLAPIPPCSSQIFRAKLSV
jgi:hypothetical protein